MGGHPGAARDTMTTNIHAFDPHTYKTQNAVLTRDGDGLSAEGGHHGGAGDEADEGQGGELAVHGGRDRADSHRTRLYRSVRAAEAAQAMSIPAAGTPGKNNGKI